MPPPNWISILSFVFVFFDSASAAVIECPLLINPNQFLTQKIKGWDLFLDHVEDIHHFNRVTFYAGLPKEHASLAPDDEHSANKKLTWTFGESAIWLACGYSKTAMQLVRKLPNNTKKCIVSYGITFDKVLTIDCI
jgi:hypothetical protein